MRAKALPAPSESPVAKPRPPAPRNRLGFRWYNHLRSWLGLPWQRRLGWAALQIPSIRHWEKQFENLSTEDLKLTGLRMRGRARGGESLDKMLPEAFGLVSVALRRITNMRPFDVQLAGAVVMHAGGLAELATGEGKTLTAALPTFLNGLQGKGVHVITVNEYLARRDAELLGPVYNSLGLTIGVIQQQMSEQDRIAAYRSDITYGTASEFGFDFLRDRLKVAGTKGQETPFWGPWTKGTYTAPLDPSVQRPHHYAVVDEADNIFIDEARTPLIIATARRAATPEEQKIYQWANEVVLKMKEDEHFLFDARKQKLEMTTGGKQLLRYSNPPTGTKSHAVDKLTEAIEQALHAHHRFRRDQHYMIDKKGQIVIIDEFTGRPMPDRHWREGLHQAVEAKEGVSVNHPSEHAAQVTFQSYFRLYKKLSGMTGTAVQNRMEIRRVYKIWVVPVPTNRPCIRKDLPDRVFATEDAKFDAIVEEVIKLKQQGRAVLIGTRSVNKSMDLSKRLTARGIKHQVLNAQPEHAGREAEIIGHAGEVGVVTIATNMAGRGTDIKPDPRVVAAGGLHVIGTERHESRRIDRQLIGRTGRQGDPGTSQFYLSLEDELLEGLGVNRQRRLQEQGRNSTQLSVNHLLPLFTLAQQRVERRHYISRVDLMVHQKQREEVLKDLGADPYVD
jgi:preprotein translocase subunit SecA